ncbi:MAG TPA: hypothetical protein VNO22_03210 [Planctomycetota bacterium]|nr:hypothetical protein [Planctomycetota bacterium]
MFSDREVRRRLAEGFVALRIDWEQGKHYKDRLGRIPGTGCQTFLDLDGRPIPEFGGVDAFASRYGRLLTPELLDRVTRRFPPRTEAAPLRLEWFLWPTERRGLWPASVDDIAGYTRTPQAWIEGPLPAALRNPDFLRRHLRQFIWVRGRPEGESRIVVRRVKDGLKPGLSPLIAEIPAGASEDVVGRALDDAWRTYMKDRPRTARGYCDNPAGRMFAPIRDRMIAEEERIEEMARAGTLPPPGRLPAAARKP